MDKNFPFLEDKYLEEIKNYILKCNTKGHYVSHGNNPDNEFLDQIHTFHMMLKGPDNRAMHYSTLTVLKYFDRFGSKDGYNRKDLLKGIHFALYALYAYDHFGPKNKSDSSYEKNSKELKDYSFEELQIEIQHRLLENPSLIKVNNENK